MTYLIRFLAYELFMKMILPSLESSTPASARGECFPMARIGYRSSRVDSQTDETIIIHLVHVSRPIARTVDEFFASCVQESASRLTQVPVTCSLALSNLSREAHLPFSDVTDLWVLIDP